MKVWAANFLRIFQSHLGADAVIGNVAVDVQAIRHVTDRHLYASRYTKLSKAELQEAQERKENAFWSEEVAIASCDLEALLRNGDGYEIKFR